MRAITFIDAEHRLHLWIHEKYKRYFDKDVGICYRYEMSNYLDK
ncbi:MAG: hypothetical protein JWN30_2687 [Bacilli bacterium]|nr:hypothetical protein [Bacilli bacterium]